MSEQPHLYVTDGSLPHRAAAILGEDPLDLISRIEAAHRTYGRQDALCKQLERQRKSLIADLRESHRARLAREGGKITESRLDDLARSDQQYKDFCERMRSEDETKEALGSEYYAMRNRFDYLIELCRLARSEAIATTA